MAVRIRNAARGDFGVEPSVALLLQGASLHDLSADLVRQLGFTADRRPTNSRMNCASERNNVPRRASEPQCGGRQDNGFD